MQKENKMKDSDLLGKKNALLDVSSKSKDNNHSALTEQEETPEKSGSEQLISKLRQKTDSTDKTSLFFQKNSPIQSNLVRDSSKNQNYNTISTKKYENGNFYTGQFKNNLKHGYGTLRTRFCIMTGIWEDDLQEGMFFLFHLNTGLAEEVIYRKGKALTSKNINTISPNQQTLHPNALKIVEKRLAEIRNYIEDSDIKVLKKRKRIRVKGKTAKNYFEKKFLLT